MTSFFKVIQNSLKVIYRDQTTIETSSLPAICISKRSNLIFLVNFPKFWNMYFFCDVIIFKLCKQGPKVVYHVSRVIERSKPIFDGTFKWGEFVSVTNFSKYCNFRSLTQNWVKKGPNLHFIYQWWWVMSSTQKWLIKVQIVFLCTDVDRKMRIKSKRYFQVNY